MAERLADPATLADALVARRFALRGPRDFAARRAASDEIVRLSATTGDVDLGLLGRSSRILDLLEIGDLAAVDIELEEIERAARLWRRPYYLWQWVLSRAMRALLDGRLADSERLAHEAFAFGRRLHGGTAGLNFGLQNFWLRRELAQLDAAKAADTIARIEATRGHNGVNRDGRTPREIEVLRALAAGDSNGEIARSLNLTLNTVERHLLNTYRKIGARGRTDAMGYAVRHNLTDPPQR